jgi:hypothetical protein
MPGLFMSVGAPKAREQLFPQREEHRWRSVSVSKSNIAGLKTDGDSDSDSDPDTGGENKGGGAPGVWETLPAHLSFKFIAGIFPPYEGLVAGAHKLLIINNNQQVFIGFSTGFPHASQVLNVAVCCLYASGRSFA